VARLHRLFRTSKNYISLEPDVDQVGGKFFLFFEGQLLYDLREKGGGSH